MNIAIIPARGGSKRIPHKNIKEFNGFPMISYSIKAAQDSNLFDHIIVSTDCPKIKAVAEKYGASVPFIRPEALSDDFTGTGAVVIHAIEWVQSNIGLPEFACCVYPTAPLIEAADLLGAYDALRNYPDKSFAFSVCRYAFPIQRALTFGNNNEINMLFPEHTGTRSQDLPEVFHDAGQFYFGRTQAFLDGTATFSSASIPCFLPRSRVIDIDEEEDWREAEIKFMSIKALEVKV